ncbi:STAS domain-containing protein [Micromonospora inaquosa]|uniref:STAS domain-containing protein n=1 Tax=Micromonospora inaquosa TaxID=2203716 RepID=UPI00244A2939|nr:STAS domain-containing protein [Micromonospora inaquosa]
MVTRHRETDHLLRLEVVGEIDMATADHVYAVVEATLAADHPTQLVIDLTAVTFLDCAGIRALISAQRAASDRATNLRVVGASRHIQRVLHLTGVQDLLAGTNPEL